MKFTQKSPFKIFCDLNPDKNNSFHSNNVLYFYPVYVIVIRVSTFGSGLVVSC